MDLYGVLGVPRDASTDDVERAYLRLARRFHPGINPGDRVAEARYDQVQRAWEVLGDPDRRREYDRGAHRTPLTRVEATVSFEGFDFSAPADGAQAATFTELFADVFQEAAREATTPTRGADLEARVTLPFERAVRGGEVPVSIVRQDRCPACGGAGRVARTPVTCPACAGEGERRWARGHMLFAKACEACGGSGQLGWQSCRPCAGVGLQPRAGVATVVVPPGLESGARVAVPGRGHAGARGGPAGDLYVTVTVAAHPHLRRDGRDLHLRLPVALHEAALGAKVAVPSLDGAVRLRIPPGTSSGQRLRLRGRGVPSAGGEAGDLIVEIQIVLPDVLDERSRELCREYGRLHPDDVRKHLFDA
ncbi:MAG: J domain-containing protein [Vicinamibacterales bacterium]